MEVEDGGCDGAGKGDGGGEGDGGRGREAVEVGEVVSGGTELPAGTRPLDSPLLAGKVVHSHFTCLVHRGGKGQHSHLNRAPAAVKPGCLALHSGRGCPRPVGAGPLWRPGLDVGGEPLLASPLTVAASIRGHAELILEEQLEDFCLFFS